MGILFPGLDPAWVRNRVCYCGRHECGQESLDLQMTAGRLPRLHWLVEESPREEALKGAPPQPEAVTVPSLERILRAEGQTLLWNLLYKFLAAAGGTVVGNCP